MPFDHHLRNLTAAPISPCAPADGRKMLDSLERAYRASRPVFIRDLCRAFAAESQGRRSLRPWARPGLVSRASRPCAGMAGTAMAPPPAGADTGAERTGVCADKRPNAVRPYIRGLSPAATRVAPGERGKRGLPFPTPGTESAPWASQRPAMFSTARPTGFSAARSSGQHDEPSINYSRGRAAPGCVRRLR